MEIRHLALAKGTVWTIGAYGTSQLIRIASNIVLARLLAPDLFGIMLIVNSLRTGLELTTDLGIGQNVVYHSNAEDPAFYQTAWSLQVVRGILLWIVCCVAAVPLAHFFETPILATIMPVFALVIVFTGFNSIGPFLLRKRMRLVRLNAFDVTVVLTGTVIQIALAYFSPTIWALVFGGMLTTLVAMIGSYFLLPGLRYKFHISGEYARQILKFGKWIFLSSIVLFLSTNFDGLYLAKSIPLDLLGIYGIARNISGLFGLLATRLSNLIVFPLIASFFEVPREALHERMGAIRLKFVAVVAVGMSLVAATADLLVGILYDQRYQAAGWLLPVLIFGAWFSTLCSLNESTLMGFGKPMYGATGNSVKLAFLVVVLPLGFMRHGIAGGVMVIALSDLCRYVPIWIGQIRERFSFGAQDVLATLLLFGLFGLWQWLRWILGFGTSFTFLPTEMMSLLSRT